MRNFLNHPDSAFYHITTWQKWKQILRDCLRGGEKGISVSRTNDSRILNSIIVLQLGTEDFEDANDYVLIKLSQLKCKFDVTNITPDIVDEWTWPLQNNIINRTVNPKSIDLVKRFSIDNWNQINIDDFRNEKIIKNEKFYTDSFQILYEDNKGNFIVNADKQIVRKELFK
jgi:hypothetical protein